MPPWDKIKLEGSYDPAKPKTGEAYAKALADLTPKITAYNSLHGTDIQIADVTTDVRKENGEWVLFVDVTPEALTRKNPEKNQRGFSSSEEAYKFAQANNIAVADPATGRYVPGGRGKTSIEWAATHEIVPDPYGDRFIIREKQEPQRKNRIIQDAVTGGWIMIDENNPYADPIPIGDAPDPVNERPTGEDIELIATETLEDKSILEFWRVGNSIKEYRSTPQNTVDPGKDFHKVEGGVFYKTSPNRYDFVPDPGEPFTPSKSRAIPELGGRMIQTSPNQWQFVRDSYEPGVVQDPLTGRFFSQNASGDWRELDYRADPGVVEIGDREFLQQHTGDLRELDRQFDPGVIRDPSGLTLIQQPTGAVTQARAANMDEIITQALIDGQVEKALAFQDFRDRPTAQEAFDTALEYARSPADQQVISSLARGETPVREPDAGVIQRVGPRPDFLVQAYQDFQRRTQTGRAPTEEEAQQLTERYATGQSPTTDKLQIEKQTLEARLEKIALDTEITREKHQAAMAQQQELHDTKILELTQKVDNAKKKAELELEYINTRRTGNGDTTTTDTTGSASVQDTSDTNVLKLEDIPPGGRTPARYSDAAAATREMETAVDNDGKLLFTQDEVTALALASGGNATQIIQQIDSRKNLRNEEIANRPYIQDPKDAAAQLQAVKDTPRIDHANVQSVIKYNEAKEAADKAVAAERAQKAADWAEGLAAPIRGRDAMSISEMAGLQTGSSTTPTESTPAAKSTSERLIQSTPYSDGSSDDEWFGSFAGGGMTRGNQLELVGEEGPELVDLPPGSFVLPLKQLNQRQMLDLKRKGVQGYANGGIVFDDNQTQSATLPFGLRQMQAGRPITPSRGYLSQQAGLRLPSAQAFQNITPESREVFLDLAAQAGIPRKSFAQELALTVPSGRRLPVARIAPAQRRAIQ